MRELAAIVERYVLAEGDDAVLRPLGVRDTAASPIVVDGDGKWFTTPSGHRVELTNSAALVGVLRALVAAHVEGRGPQSTSALAAEAWPNERIVPRAARRGSLESGKRCRCSTSATARAPLLALEEPRDVPSPRRRVALDDRVRRRHG
ncbi:MAG TPA: hypothetical protein VM580_17150, partial [Labilithrix sp.]|nr:hypothetical protein [Labilithrix sp.]